MDDNWGLLPTTMGKPVIVLEIIQRLRQHAKSLRSLGMTGWEGVNVRVEAQGFENAADLIEKEFYK